MKDKPLKELANGELCNPDSCQFRCKAQGLKYVGFFTPEQRHEKLKHYCKKNKTTISDLINSFLSKTLKSSE